jgi:hypothetical protein
MLTVEGESQRQFYLLHLHMLCRELTHFIVYWFNNILNANFAIELNYIGLQEPILNTRFNFQGYQITRS